MSWPVGEVREYRRRLRHQPIGDLIEDGFTVVHIDPRYESRLLERRVPERLSARFELVALLLVTLTLASLCWAGRWMEQADARAKAGPQTVVEAGR